MDSTVNPPKRQVNGRRLHEGSSNLLKTPEQRAREYRARHKFNFLNTVTRHEIDLSVFTRPK